MRKRKKKGEDTEKEKNREDLREDFDGLEEEDVVERQGTLGVNPTRRVMSTKKGDHEAKLNGNPLGRLMGYNHVKRSAFRSSPRVIDPPIKGKASGQGPNRRGVGFGCPEDTVS